MVNFQDGICRMWNKAGIFIKHHTSLIPRRKLQPGNTAAVCFNTANYFFLPYQAILQHLTCVDTSFLYWISFPWTPFLLTPPILLAPPAHKPGLTAGLLQVVGTHSLPCGSRGASGWHLTELRSTSSLTAHSTCTFCPSGLDLACSEIEQGNV